MTHLSLTWLLPLLLCAPAFQDRGLPKEAAAKLEELLKGLDSDESPQREASQRQLHEMSARYGKAFVDVLKSRSTGVPVQVKASIEEFLAYRGRVLKACGALSAFDALDTPDLKGKRFVIFNTGGYSTQGATLDFHYVYGWLLGETKDNIRLADESFTCGVITAWKELPRDWDRYKDKHPQNAPLPGFYREVDFDLFCKELIESGTTPSTHPFARRERVHLVGTAIYAYWAFKTGRDETGLKLLAEVEEVFKGPHNDWVKSMKSVSELLECSLVQELRVRAIESARGGAPRAELLTSWKLIRDRLPENEYPGEAKAMCKHYEDLLKEDESRVETKQEAFAKLTASQKVDYWMYRLRELPCSQWSDPGECNILENGFFGEKDRPLNAAQELVKLGMAAVPALIEHLEDERPTRSVGWHRMFNHGSYYLLRYGDCCQQIFQAITRQEIYSRSSTNGYPIKDGVGAAVRKRAQEWWEKNLKK